VAEPTEAEIAGEVLRAAGIQYTVSLRGKHYKLRWKIGGKSFSYSCAKTPSDCRAALNCRATVRRILRREGL
jgi:hypothetical protein